MDSLSVLNAETLITLILHRGHPGSGRSRTLPEPTQRMRWDRRRGHAYRSVRDPSSGLRRAVVSLEALCGGTTLSAWEPG